MKKKEKSATKSGFSYIEYLFSLFLMMNLFVLCHQIFYNITISDKQIENNRLLTYETISTRIEMHLKEVTVYKIEENRLSYTYQNVSYTYYVAYTSLMVRIGTKSFYLIKDLSSIKFNQTGYFLSICFVDLNQDSYCTKVIHYDP